MSDLSSRRLVIVTRPSKLARWQAQAVQQALARQWPKLGLETVVISTRGDRTLDRPLPEIGGKGLFTLELETALREDRADLAVHSLKDLPLETPKGLCLGAILLREDPRDVLVSREGIRLDELGPGSTVGTSSTRRTAQILALRPDLKVEPIRGNVDTRLRKVREGQYDASVMAAAGLLRLGLDNAITEWFHFDQMLPAPGQGALAVQCRADDSETLELLAAIEAPGDRRLVLAERAMLGRLGGGCAAPVGAIATEQRGGIHLRGMVATVDGSRLLRASGSGADPQQLGRRVAEQLLQHGAQEIMAHAR